MVSYSTYSSNNHKQQQRRKLLFEYGLEKKLQSQSLASQAANSCQQEKRIMPIYMGPGGPGPYMCKQFRRQEQLKLSEQNALFEKLRNLNINELDSKEQERLKYLSD